MLRGDELGVVFGEAIARTINKGTFANSIVSSSALKKIANHYSLDFKETLTGFKWLAKIENLTFGYEEAIGYCVDSKTVNDKDGISAALYLAQIASDLAQEDKTLQDLLNDVWARDGFHATEQISIRFTDLSKMDLILADLRANPPREIAGIHVDSIDDLAMPSSDLPPTEGIRIWLVGGIRIIIRPSGTEPKMKCYIEVIATDEKVAQSQLEMLRGPLRKLLSRD
jgi:phosphomannomutase